MYRQLLICTVAASTCIHASSHPLNTFYDKTNNMFSIEESDRDLFTKSDSASTYGEITPEALEQLAAYLNPTPKDVFLDLGSGKGQAPLYMALYTPIRRSMGVELSEKRHQSALEALKRARSSGQLPKNHTVVFKQADFTDPKLDFSRATIVWLNSTCYPDHIMEKLGKRLAQLKKGTRIVTLKKFNKPEQYGFKQIAQLKLPMSWAKNQTTYIYVIQ